MKVHGFKARLKVRLIRMGMWKEFYWDFIHYKKWNYNNPSTNTLAAQESRILRQTHMIEKGLSLSHPRTGFGTAKIATLIQFLDDYIEAGHSTERIPFRNALDVLHSYVQFQSKKGYHNPYLEKKLDGYLNTLSFNFSAGINTISKSSLSEARHAEFPEFFRSRHSIRQFSEESVTAEEVEKAIDIARRAPTACNRQATHVYYYNDPEKNRELGKLIAGNTGFDSEVKNYLVVTADVSSFYDTFERNQMYVEGGIFTMALIESLHYFGIASCVLQNGEYHRRNREFKRVCQNISESERIVLFIAIGHYKNEFQYAVSNRKNVKDILIED